MANMQWLSQHWGGHQRSCSWPRQQFIQTSGLQLQHTHWQYLPSSRRQQRRATILSPVYIWKVLQQKGKEMQVQRFWSNWPTLSLRRVLSWKTYNKKEQASHCDSANKSEGIWKLSGDKLPAIKDIPPPFITFRGKKCPPCIKGCSEGLSCT